MSYAIQLSLKNTKPRTNQHQSHPSLMAGKKRSASISNRTAKRVKSLATKDKDTGKSAPPVQKEAGNGHRDGNNDEINVISDSDSDGEEDPEIELGTCGKPDGNHRGALTAHQNGSVRSGPHRYMHSINLHLRLNIKRGAVVMSSPVHRSAANSVVAGF